MANNGGGLSGFWRRVWTNPTLEWGCEISPEGVCLTRWEAGSRGLGTAAWRPLPSGAMEVSPLRENLLQPELVRQALSGCLESLGRSNGMQSAGRPVDTHATFPGGTEGAGLNGLRRYLREHRQDEFLDNLCRKVLAYGLGRTLLLSDDPMIEDMRAKLKANGYRFGSLVESIVTSPQFLTRRSQPDLTQK